MGATTSAEKSQSLKINTVSGQTIYNEETKYKINGYRSGVIKNVETEANTSIKTLKCSLQEVKEIHLLSLRYAAGSDDGDDDGFNDDGNTNDLTRYKIRN